MCVVSGALCSTTLQTSFTAAWPTGNREIFAEKVLSTVNINMTNERVKTEKPGQNTGLKH